jgi:hypothetical protein
MDYPEIVIRTDPNWKVEPLGSKPKFWVRGPNGRRALFKQSREGTGEDWAECVASHLAALLNLPHALYNFARTDTGILGVLSRSFLQSEDAEYLGSLTVGNEILATTYPGYPRLAVPGKHRRAPEHTVDAILDACKLAEPPLGWPVTPGVGDGADVVVGYLLLDAWIGNTDRHDENWGWVRATATSRFHLAPTFDHASSLGRNESDDRRRMRLATPDPAASAAAYALRARSGIYAGGRRPVRTLEAFARAAELRPTAASIWLQRLASISMAQCAEVLAPVPDNRMSPVAKDFAHAILQATREALLAGGI